MIFTHCSQFHNCIPYTDKKSFTFNTHVATSFLKIAFTFPFFFRNFCMSDILAEPLFDWFINLLRPSTFSYKEEKSMITAIQYVTIQTYFIDENALQKIKLDTVYHTTAHYTAQLLFAICNHNIMFLLSELKRYLAR